MYTHWRRKTIERCFVWHKQQAKTIFGSSRWSLSNTFSIWNLRNCYLFNQNRFKFYFRCIAFTFTSLPVVWCLSLFIPFDEYTFYIVAIGKWNGASNEIKFLGRIFFKLDVFKSLLVVCFKIIAICPFNHLFKRMHK